MIIQVYEIQEPSEAERLIEMGVDHIGSVVLSEKTWKHPPLRETIRLINRSDAQSSLIPLFSTFDSISRVIDYYQPRIIHFCESLVDKRIDAADCETLINLQENVKNRFPEVKIMRSIPIPETGLGESEPVLKLSRIFEPISDYFLTDTLLSHETGISDEHQPVKGFVGITGRTCNWDIARKLVDSCGIPVILAGGISPDNVADGITAVYPAGVDSCTNTNVVNNHGVPTRFKKDFAKVKRLIEEVRRAESIKNN